MMIRGDRGIGAGMDMRIPLSKWGKREKETDRLQWEGGDRPFLNMWEFRQTGTESLERVSLGWG